MPAKASILYLREKYIHEIKFHSIVSDYLYILASSNLNENARKDLKRYAEIIISKPSQQIIDNRTAEEIIDDIINPKGR